MGDVTEIGDGGAGSRIWVCGCGCSTFEVRDDGAAICANCEEIAHLQIGGWFSPDAKVVTEAPDRVVSGNGSIEFLRQRLSRMALEPETVGIVIMRESGEVSFMESAGTKERRRWYLERLKIARKILKGKG